MILNCSGASRFSSIYIGSIFCFVLLAWPSVSWAIRFTGDLPSLEEKKEKLDCSRPEFLENLVLIPHGRAQLYCFTRTCEGGVPCDSNRTRFHLKYSDDGQISFASIECLPRLAQGVKVPADAFVYSRVFDAMAKAKKARNLDHQSKEADTQKLLHEVAQDASKLFIDPLVHHCVSNEHFSGLSAHIKNGCSLVKTFLRSESAKDFAKLAAFHAERLREAIKKSREVERQAAALEEDHAKKTESIHARHEQEVEELAQKLSQRLEQIEAVRQEVVLEGLKERLTSSKSADRQARLADQQKKLDTIRHLSDDAIDSIMDQYVEVQEQTAAYKKEQERKKRAAHEEALKQLESEARALAEREKAELAQKKTGKLRSLAEEKVRSQQKLELLQSKETVEHYLARKKEFKERISKVKPPVEGYQGKQTMKSGDTFSIDSPGRWYTSIHFKDRSIRFNNQDAQAFVLHYLNDSPAPEVVAQKRCMNMKTCIHLEFLDGTQISVYPEDAEYLQRLFPHLH